MKKTKFSQISQNEARNNDIAFIDNKLSLIAGITMKNGLLSFILLFLLLFNQVYSQTIDFFYTGSVQTYTVPTGVTELNVTLKGASGGNSTWGTATGGRGATVQATISVTPGSTINVYVGGQNGWNGGGEPGGSPTSAAGRGGDASDIRIGGTALSDRVLVAGGGGGAGAAGSNWQNLPNTPIGFGGNGGHSNASGGAGSDFDYGSGSGLGVTVGGQGGAVGIGGVKGTGCSLALGTNGANTGQGGTASNAVGNNLVNRPHGGGGGGGFVNGGGGGSGGIGNFNCGGSNSTNTTGGGAGAGGSNYTTGATNVTIVDGSNTGEGFISITAIPSGPTLVSNATISSFSTCSGSSSAAQNITVSGTNLIADIIISAPTGFEVSTTSGSGFGSSVTLTQSGGTVSSTTVFVRMSSTSTGSPSGDLTIGSTNATTQNIAVSGTVNSLPPATIAVTETSGTTNNDGSICNGASATLTATGGGTYAWSTAATTASISPSPSATTTYTVTVTNTAGCSATSNSTLTVNNLPTASITVSETSGLQVNDATICTGDFVDLTASGASSVFWNTSATTTTISVNPSSLTTYTATVTDANGCSDSETQSIVVSALPTPSSQSFTICFGDSIIVGSNTYISTGVYTDTFTGINGCDSVVTTTLVISPQITSSQSFTICNGESVSVGTSTYLIAGTYLDTLTATNGCDSLVTTNLTVNPVFTTNNPIVVCFGETYTIGDSTYTTSGVYTNLFEAISGCDSTVTTNLTILPLSTHTQSINVCFGESYSIGNNTYSSNGTYIDTLVSAFGCDSIVTTQLTINNQINTATTVNEITISATATGATYQWINCANNQAISGATSQSYTATANGDYAVIVTQNNCSDTSACTTFSTIGINELNASFNLYPNPATSTITITSSQTIEQIVITDLSGKVISILPEKGMNQTIDVSDLSRGMYLVKVISQGNQITKQFVKE